MRGGADRAAPAGEPTGYSCLLEEIHQQIPGLDTVVVAVGGGLFAGVATAARHHGIRTVAVAVEPDNCRALNAALEAGRPVDVTVGSVAADSLDARRASAMALHAAQQDGVHSVLVPDAEIVRARKALWDHRKVAVEHGAATALAALTSPDERLFRGASARRRPAGPARHPPSRLPARKGREGLRRAVRRQHRPHRSDRTAHRAVTSATEVVPGAEAPT